MTHYDFGDSLTSFHEPLSGQNCLAYDLIPAKLFPQSYFVSACKILSMENILSVKYHHVRKERKKNKCILISAVKNNALTQLIKLQDYLVLFF